MTEELRKELREVHKQQAEWANIESDIQQVLLRTEVNSLWHRFFAWLLRKAAAFRQECAEDRREIEDEIRRSER